MANLEGFPDNVGTTVIAGGKVMAVWDNDTNTYKEFNDDGSVKSERPYTPAEEEAAAEMRLEELKSANKDLLRAGLQDLIAAALERQEAVQLVIDTKNSDINSSPAPHIKTLARACKREERAIIRLARIVGNLTESTDTGTD